MLNQHHKSQLRGKSDKKYFLYISSFDETKLGEVKEFRARLFTILPRIALIVRPATKGFTILDYHSEPSITIKPMRIKRESPCLGLRFMPIKLSK